MLTKELLDELILTITDIDFGLVDDRHYFDGVLKQLESLADLLTKLGLPTGEIDAAVYWLFKDTDRAKEYIFGPTDIGNGKGVLPNLRRMRNELED